MAYDANTIVMPKEQPRSTGSWWIGLAPDEFYQAARKQRALMSESTFGTWSNKGPTTVQPEKHG